MSAIPRPLERPSEPPYTSQSSLQSGIPRAKLNVKGKTMGIVLGRRLSLVPVRCPYEHSTLRCTRIVPLLTFCSRCNG